jgi:hypothetical protein
MLLWSVPFLAGCVAAPTAPAPPIDAAVPAKTGTATFGLG